MTLEPTSQPDRITTGVSGLDFMARGGLPKNRLTLVAGGPGAGKTVLSLQFINGGLGSDEGGAVYVTFEEPPEQLLATAESFGWEFSKAIEDERLTFVDASIARREDVIEAGPFDLDALIARIEHAVKTTGASRLVLDSFGAALAGFNRPELVRREIVRLGNAIRRLGVSAMITAERTQGEMDGPHGHGFEEFVVDNVILVDNTLEDVSRRRTIEILKFRGAGHNQGQFSMTITSELGISVVALPEVKLDQPAAEIRIPSGVPELDLMCGGGFLRDSVVLVSGTTGTGKTLISTSFMNGGASQGERCLLLGYEESRDQLIRNATGWNVDYPGMEEQGLLRIECSYPERLSLEEHLLRIEQLLDEFKPDRITLDSLSALERSSPHRSFREFVIALTASLKERQIAAVLTSAGSTALGAAAQVSAEAHLSTLTDSIILLRYVEVGGRVSRAVTVLKMRGSAHDKVIREFTVDSNGMNIGEPFRNLYGILTGEVRAMPGFDSSRLTGIFDV